MVNAQEPQANGQKPIAADTLTAVNDTLTADSAMALIDADLTGPDEMDEQGGGLHKQLKHKFIEGSASFMSLVALALILVVGTRLPVC